MKQVLSWQRDTHLTWKSGQAACCVMIRSKALLIKGVSSLAFSFSCKVTWSSFPIIPGLFFYHSVVEKKLKTISQRKQVNWWWGNEATCCNYTKRQWNPGKALLKDVSMGDLKKPLKYIRASKTLRIYPQICTTSFLICQKGKDFHNRNIPKSTLRKRREEYK